MSAETVTIFLISISVMLIMAKLLGEFFVLIKQPAIIGEILAGVLLGPTVLGMISPGTFNFLFPQGTELSTALEGITTIAVVMLLLVSGLEVDLAVVLRHRKTAVSTSLIGIVVPFGLGFGFSYLFPQLMGVQDENMHLVFALFIGTAIAISSLPVIAKILIDLNIFKTQIGFIIIAAAMLNDLLGWMIFSVILGLIGGAGHALSFDQTFLYTIIFVVVVLFAGRKLFNYAVPWIQDKLTYPGGILNFILIMGFLGAAFTEYIGVHAILGAFIVGIAVGDSAHLKERTREIIQQFVTNIFAPLFFVSIGLRVNFIANFNLVIVLVLLIIALTGKVAGSAIGARVGGLSKNESLAVGFGMSSSGAMGIIIGLVALEFGLITEEVFVGLVIMALFTSIASAPMMNYFLKRKDEFSLNNLLAAGNVLFTTASDKYDVIKQLSDFAAGRLKLNASGVLSSVLKREEQSSTGIINYLAIPHAKLNIAKPFAAAAKLESGVNFDAFDSVDSRVIILLLTPEKNNELQLRLLAEAAKKFEDRGRIEELLEIKDKEAFAEKLKSL